MYTVHFATLRKEDFQFHDNEKEDADKGFDRGLCWNLFKQSYGAKNLVGIGLAYRPARLHRLEELIPWNRFLGSLKV
jgi:hypothetical protein